MMDGTNLYCERCSAEYERLVNNFNDEVLCICPRCGFKDSDIMNDEEKEKSIVDEVMKRR